MILIYTYLYVVYRERYIGHWLLGWLILFLRGVFLDSGIFDWTNSVTGFTCFQVLIIMAILIYVWGIYIFIGKPIKIWWIYAALGTSVLSFIFTIMDLPITYKLFPPAWFGGITAIWLGIIFMRHLKVSKVSKQILAFAYTLWGMHSLDMPFFIDVSWFVPWGYLIDCILRLIVALCTLVVYFENIRLDLVQKEAQYRLLAENAIDIIYRYRVSPEAYFEYISPSVLAVTGYTPEEYYSDPRLMLHLTHPDDVSQLCNFLQNPSCSRSFPLAFRLTRKDQSTIWVEQTGVPFYAEDGTMLALEGIIRDITFRKKMEYIASRADRMNTVGEMAASVAHEIRNPLTTVRGYLQLLLSKKEFDRYRDNFELMIDELDRTNTIIREYLCLAKDKRADLKICSLNKIIESLFPLIQADAVASKIAVSLDLSEIPELQLDENEIRQLLLNLVRNGLEAMPSGGCLNIRTFWDNDKAVLSVSDHGPGMPEYIFNNLGTPFLTTKDNGTGLGLPMCYRIANRHQADIDVKTSESGTTFYIRFNHPLASN